FCVVLPGCGAGAPPRVSLPQVQVGVPPDPSDATASVASGGTVVSYFGDIWDGIRTTAQGFKITLSYLKKTPYTLQYPDEALVIDRVTHRGIHEFDVDRCISCFQCSNACPVDCIYIESAPDAKGKPTKGEVSIMTRFDIDYSKCL